MRGSSALDTNSGPLSLRGKLGAPRALTRRDSTSMTRGERMRALTSIASPSLLNSSVTESARSPYAQLQKAGDASFPRGHRFYWKAQFLSEVTKAVADALSIGSRPSHPRTRSSYSSRWVARSPGYRPRFFVVELRALPMSHMGSIATEIRCRYSVRLGPNCGSRGADIVARSTTLNV
jgi:hypothetical protein